MKIKNRDKYIYYLFTGKFSKREQALNELKKIKKLGFKAEISGL